MPNSHRILGCLLGLAASTCAYATVNCRVLGVPTPVRAESLSERVGDIMLVCRGAPGESMAGNLSVFLPYAVTNRRLPNDTLEHALLTADGAPVAVPAQPLGSGGATFNGINIVMPAGMATLRVSNLRVAIGQPVVVSPQPVRALLGFFGNAVLTTPHVNVGVLMNGLLAGSTAGSVNCYGSPFPAELTMSSLFKTGTRVFSTRLTEGFASAFEARTAQTDTGTRIVVSYSGFPAGARLFVPTFIAGSTALEPTGGGDLFAGPSGGAYAPSTEGSLLLSLVTGADANGAGGTPAPAPATLTPFNLAAELALTNGSGMAVYEVLDSNPVKWENAEMPTFFGIPRTDGVSTAVARQSVSLGPLSTVRIATATDPIPRFIAAVPPVDCLANGDCQAFPKLFVNAPKPFKFTTTAGGERMSEAASVENTGGGTLAWTLTVAYKNGADWISLYAEPNRGPVPGLFRLTVDPGKLPPGTYEATLTVDAGATAGLAAIPVSMLILPAPAPPPAAGPRVNTVVHAATLLPGPVVPGSLAAVFGTGLKGTTVSVTFDGIPAALLYVADSQINLHVPPELGLRNSDQMIVTVDGIAGAPVTVALSAIAPALFPNGLLNQDFFANSANNPAAAGSVLILFLTGLNADAGPVSVRVHDREITALDFAGPAPTLTGVQQVNVRLPDDLSGMTTDLQVCITGATNGQRVCSPAAKVSIR